MKRMYVILFAAALTASALSCEEKNFPEKAKDNMQETDDTAKTKVGKAIEDESERTTKNGSDAH